MRLFLYVAIPIFILVHFAVENYARKEYKDVKLNRAFRIGRRLMLSSGFVLILRALLGGIELFTSTGYMVDVSRELVPVSFTVNLVYVILHLIIGYIGYKTWKDPTKKMLKIGFAAGIALLVITVAGMIMSGGVIRYGSVLLLIDSVVVLAITVAYITGSFIVRANYGLGLLKPRDK